MSDVTVTVTLRDDERHALDTIAVFAVERREMPPHFMEDGTLLHSLSSAIAKLRAAQPAAMGPLERLEAWLSANINDGARFAFFPGQPAEWECQLGEQVVRWLDGDDYSIETEGVCVYAPTIAEAIDDALAKEAECIKSLEAQP